MVALAALLVTVIVAAQVVPAAEPHLVVSQGQAPASSQAASEFHSPMLLEVSLEEIPFGEERAVRGVRQFYCDDVTVSTLTIRRDRVARGGLAVVLKGTLYVRPSHDRRTTLRFDLLNGDQRLGPSSRLEKLKTEEGKAFQARLELTPGDADRLFRSPGDARVRIEMTVQDDD